MSMSPCTKNCSLNNSTNICKGCGRTINEIVEWTRMTDEEKQEAMKRLNGNQSISSIYLKMSLVYLVLILSRLRLWKIWKS